MAPRHPCCPVNRRTRVAAQIAEREEQQRRHAARSVKERFLRELAQVEYFLNGDATRTQSHVVNLSFPGIDSEALMMAVREELAISNGAACTSASYSPSHVLTAMGLSEDRINSAVRISWGPAVNAIPVEPLVAAVNSMRG